MKNILLLALAPFYLYAMDPLCDNKSKIILIGTGGSDLSVINAARISYDRSSERIEQRDCALLSALAKSGHMTPFEQTFLQFEVVAPIFVARQWMRHRIGVSYNEQSARYTTLHSGYYVPRHIMGSESQAAFVETCERSIKTYEYLLENKIAKEEARSLLPVCMYTHFFFGCNLASLFHFIQLRADTHAQWEIQQYACCMLKLAYSKFPESVKAWSSHHNPDLAAKL